MRAEAEGVGALMDMMMLFMLSEKLDGGTSMAWGGRREESQAWLERWLSVLLELIVNEGQGPGNGAGRAFEVGSARRRRSSTVTGVEVERLIFFGPRWVTMVPLFRIGVTQPTMEPAPEEMLESARVMDEAKDADDPGRRVPATWPAEATAREARARRRPSLRLLAVRT